MEYVKSLFKNLGEFTSRMTPSQVMLLLGVVAGTVVGGILLAGWLNTVNYARLYSDLDQREAGDIVTYLTDHKIPYQLTDGGRTIEVPADDVYSVRLSLASEGLPSSGNVGYSIFDQNNLGMTDFLQNLNFRRALEGELTRTITQMNEVKAARVHIVLPKERLFKQDQKEPTASVVLKLSGIGGLSKNQLAGISHLVASSVEGLKPGNITIVDYDGNLLSSGQEEDKLAGLSSSQLEVRQQVEDYLQTKAQSMLDGVLGAGNAIIRVTADLNFQQLERTAETYDPNSPSVRSEERTKQTATSSDKADENDESASEEGTETTVTNYELNRTVEHIVNAVGTIDRLSVAVLVDGTYSAVEGEGGGTEQLYQPRTQDELDRLASIVKNAVGFDQQRNDQIEMVNIAFDRQNLESDQQALDSMYLRDFYWDIAKRVGLVLLFVMGLLYLKKKSSKLFKALAAFLPKPPPPPPKPQPVTAQAIQDEEQPQIVIEAEKRKPRLVDQMQKTAEERPEEIAKVIKTMMID
ncbi:flagellar M-ring protein FliF [bacterium]|nr:flagellar M-ring protein FliF [bacterium]MCB2201568.1 flagellar M-ring protein FliF [bacterium]